MVLMINLTGSLAGVGANLPAGFRDIGTGPVTLETQAGSAWDTLDCASPDVGRFCDDIPFT